METTRTAGRLCEMEKRVKKPNTTTKPWFNGDCRQKRKVLFKTLKRYLKESNMSNKKALYEARKSFKEICKVKKEEWLEEKRSRINKSRNMSQWWEAVNAFRGKPRKEASKEISDHQWTSHFMGTMGGSASRAESREVPTQHTEEIQEGLEEGQEDLLDREDDEMNADNMEAEIKMAELKAALKRMKNRKAPGEDGLVAEFYKEMPAEGKQELLEALNEIWRKGNLPRGWESAHIAPIFKAGNPTNPRNYRPISLLNAGYKTLTNIVTTRLEKWCEENRILKES